MMARVIPFVVILCGITVHATNWEFLDQSPEPIIGLLDLPDIVGDGCGALAHRATSTVFVRPTQDAPRVATVFMRDEGNAGCWLMVERINGAKEDLPNLETGYEIGAAIVYQRRAAWYRIALTNGSGWIRRNNAKDFLPYPEILRDRLGYLAEDWQARLRATPGRSGEIVRAPSGVKDRQIGMRYLRSRQVRGALWLQVQLLSGQCLDTVQGITISTVWVPAYRPNGSPAAWFHSRGC